MNKIIKFAIQFGPTILFVLIVLSSMLINFFRGTKKSKDLLIRSAIFFAIYFSLYLIFSNVVFIDELIFKGVNMILGSNTAIQELLSVSNNCSNFREAIVEYVISFFGQEGDLAILANDNKEILLMIVNMIYHLVFAIINYIFYSITCTISFIQYSIKHSPKREKINNEYEIATNQTDRVYRKKHLGGLFIGLFRGVASGIIVLTLIGSPLYVIAGKGQNNRSDLTLEVESPFDVYECYQDISSYGDYGVYKVLNSLATEDDYPFYLFALDLVMSGNYQVEEEEINQRFSLTYELGNLTGFAEETLNLFIKYGGQDFLTRYINGEVLQEDLIDLLSNEAFQLEFEKVIKDLDTSSCFFTLATSLITSVCKNIDTLSMTMSLPEEAKEIISILFAPGYYCPSIPYENEMIVSDLTTKKLAYLNPNILLDNNTLKEAFFIVIDVLNSNVESENYLIDLLNKILPRVSNISLLQDENKDIVNPVLARVFNYASAKFLSEETFNKTINQDDSLSERRLQLSRKLERMSNSEEVDWVEEIKGLLEIFTNLYELIKENFIDGENNILESFINLFDKDNEKYENNSKNLEVVTSYLFNSQLLNEVINTSYITSIIKSAFSNVVTDTSFLDSIEYANRFDEEGKLIEYGELYNLFSLLEELANNGNLDVILNLISGGEGDNQISDLLSLMKDEKFLDKALGSNIISSVLSNNIDQIFVPLLVNEDLRIDEDEANIVLSKIKKETNGSKPYSYTKEEFKNLIECINLIGLDELFNGGSFEDILNKLLDTESDAYIGNQIETYYRSTLIKYVISNQISSVLLSGEESIINANQLDLVFVDDINIRYNYISLEEVTSLINGTNELGIDLKDPKIDDISISDILNKEKLDSLYQSTIFKIILTTFIDTFLEEELSISEDVITSCKVKDEKNEDILYYNSQELLNLNDALKNYDIDISQKEITVDFQDIAKKIQNDRETLNLSYNSSILFRAVLTSTIDDNIGDDVNNPEAIKKCKGKDNLYLLEEINYFLDVLNDFEIDLSEEIEDSAVYNKLNKENLQSAYKSTLFWGILTSTLDYYIKEQVNTVKIMSACKDEVNLYKYSEIEYLFDALDVFKIKLDQEIDTEEVYKSLNKENINVSYKSLLFRGILTKNLDELFDSNKNIKGSYKAKDPDDYNIYRQSELLAIIDFTGGDISSFDASKITISNLLKQFDPSNNYACSSYIIEATISNVLLNKSSSEIIIPSSIVDENQIIRGEEVYKLFFAFDKLGYTNMSNNFADSSITDSNMINLICDSTIFNATVISKLSSSKPIFVEDNDKYRVIDNDQEGNEIIYLTKNEIRNFLTLNNEINQGNLSGINQEVFFSAIAIKEEAEIIKDLNSSNIVYNLVSEYLLSIESKYPVISLSKETLSVCNLINTEKSDKEVVSKNSIIIAIATLKAYGIIK